MLFRICYPIHGSRYIAVTLILDVFSHYVVTAFFLTLVVTPLIEFELSLTESKNYLQYRKSGNTINFSELICEVKPVCHPYYGPLFMSLCL